MKHLTLLVLLLIPFSLFAIDKGDSINISQNERIENNIEKIQTIQKEIIFLNQRQVAQDNLHEKTINGISGQLSAASYNLTIFGILFAIAAIILGIYVTRIEYKIVRIKEENQILLNKTIKNKEEVVAINNLIQKDIYGLYLKIKREETVHLIKRLSVVPEDITNLLEQLLSRELAKEDFEILKKAYLRIKEKPKESRAPFSTQPNNIDAYKLLFFQHFFGLAVIDKEISDDMFNFYSIGIKSSFENDIIKSTEDFINAITENGYQTKQKEIKNFIECLSISKYQNMEILYKIIFDVLKIRENQFEFYEIISNDKKSRIGKLNYGKVLQASYSSTKLSDTEQAVFENTNKIISELENEEKEQLDAEKKRKEDAEKKKLEQIKKTNPNKK